MAAHLDQQHWRSSSRSVRGLVPLALLVTALLAGCAQQRYITRRDQPNRLFGRTLGLLARREPKPTPRTLQLLRRYDLVKLQEKNPEQTLTKLQQEIESDPNPDKIC